MNPEDDNGGSLERLVRPRCTAQSEGQNVVLQQNAGQCISESWKSSKEFLPRPISKWLRAAESSPHLFERLAACSVGTMHAVEELKDLLCLWKSRGRPDLGVWPLSKCSSFDIGELRRHIVQWPNEEAEAQPPNKQEHGK